jgi:xylulokinase
VAERDPVAIGIDVGTSGVGVVAVTAAGRIVARADHAVPLLTPQPGWTEQEPQAWIAAAEAGLAEVAAEAGADRVLAIAAAGQMHGMAALDRHDRPVRPALLWNDARTGAEAAELEALLGRERLVERTGNPAIAGFQLPKVLWLRRHEPAAFARTVRVLFPKDVLTLHLCGEAIAEPTDASGSGAFDLSRGVWDEEILGAVGLDTGLWPRVVATGSTVGGLRHEVAARLGLRPQTPVVAGAGDNAAAATALGIGRHRPELGSVSLGTSGVVQVPLAAPTPDPQGRVHLFAHADGGYLLMGVTLAAAGSLRWFRDTLAPGVAYEVLLAEAAAAPIGAHGVVVRPHLAGERSPYLRTDLRGAFHGLSLATSRGDLVRALLEGVAFSLRDAFDVVTAIAGPERLIATGGGAASDLWLQILADALEVPVGRPVDEGGQPAEVGAAEGAAALAWQALGRDLREPVHVRTWREPVEAGAPATRAALERYRAHEPSA